MKLNAEDAARLIKHITEDKPNHTVKRALARGREILELTEQSRLSKTIMSTIRTHFKPHTYSDANGTVTFYCVGDHTIIDSISVIPENGGRNERHYSVKDW